MRTSSTLADVAQADAASDERQTGTGRRLVVTWQNPIDRRISPVGMLNFDGQTYSFYYIRNALRVAGFRPFLGFPDLQVRYQSNRLFPLFAQRAMTPRRPDFTRWVTRLGLTEDATPWEQIARSGGRREGDTIQLFPAPVISDGRLDCDFLVHGMRYVLERKLPVGKEFWRPPTRTELEARLSTLRPDDELRLLNEPTNRVNTRAILATTTDDFPLGWVPDLLVEEIHRVPNRSSVRASVRVVNGPEAGWHLRLLAHLTAEVPDDFEVFEGTGWESLETDPANCPHTNVTVHGLGGVIDGNVDTVSSDWATCRDCGAKVPNPLSEAGGP
ncbi:hypothetical protein ACKUVQ_10850 [Mycobacterium seoulense]|uniref:hypothetical protein n=1 Tax=Mycobacterium seoulense TaxID=386911 RepID=UPI003CE78E9C